MPARPSVVCTECHRLKIGCNKAVPCEQCTIHHRICQYPPPSAPPIDNDVLQGRLLNFEQFYERERQKFLAPSAPLARRTDFNKPPSESSSEARQDALLAACPSDVFRLFSNVLSLSPERVSSIQSAHATNRPPIPLFLLPDHYYYIDRDGDPCVTPALLSLLPSFDQQADLLNTLKDVFLFQPLGGHDDLLRRIDIFRNTGTAVQDTRGLSALRHLGLYAVAAGAFALGVIGSSHVVLSSTRATNLYNAGRRALQLVIDHPLASPNSVDHLWSGMLLYQFLLFAHRLAGGELPHSGAFHREWVRAEIDVVLRMVVHACGDQETNQSPQQPVSQNMHFRDLQERAKLARAAYYYEMHTADVFNASSLFPLDPPFFQTPLDPDTLFHTTRTDLVKLIKISRHQLNAATSKNSQCSAIDVVVSRSDAIKTFLTTMPASLILDIEDVGRIENVQTAVQGIELVLEGWMGVIRLWKHLLAIETSPVTAATPTPSDALGSASSQRSSGSPSASNESLSRCIVKRATRPCVELITLLHVQFQIITREPRFHFYLYSQAVPRRAFDSGLVLARILTLCDDEQDRGIAAQALGALRGAIDLLERAASWFRAQSGEAVVEEAGTLKLLRMLLARTSDRVELLDVDSAGSKRSREAMEGMSDISAARLGDLHGLRLPFTPDMVIFDSDNPARSLSMTQQPGTHSTFHRQSPAKSTPSSSAHSPSSTSLSTSIDTNVVPEPSISGFVADDLATRQKRPPPVRSFGRPSPPVLKEGPYGEDRELDRVPKLRKIHPKGMLPQAGESDPRASQPTRGVAVNQDHISHVPFNVQHVRSNGHSHLQASQQRSVGSAFTGSPDNPPDSSTTSNPFTANIWMGHPWRDIPTLSPVSEPEAYVQLHENPFPMTGPTTSGMYSYTKEPYTSLNMPSMSFAPAPPLHAPVGETPGALRTYGLYPPTLSTTAAVPETSPTNSYFSPYGPSPLTPSVPSLYNEPLVDSIPQPDPRALVTQHPQHPQYPQYPQQQPWHYETPHQP